MFPLKLVKYLNIYPMTRRREEAHLVFDDGETSDISWLMPQVGVEATSSVSLGAQGALWVEPVVISLRQYFVVDLVLLLTVC